MVGIERAWFQGLSAANKDRARKVSTRVDLGDPIRLVVAGTEYFCFDDPKLTITTAQIVERFPATEGHVRGADEDWTTATYAEGA